MMETFGMEITVLLLLGTLVGGIALASRFGIGGI
ncbi:hypothetical protein QO011_006251 [Labrys wisconsinensis]|uniref:Uncharacterized protein n=1 Tax=Labrys wisconsinensis TaxID=425677 RepID=A0ABU0JFZ9_9HYPH|nr:hypothetical protein [Labrys wisconsinensis]